MGRTQPEKRYILDTILEHMPRVSGSEEDMHVHVVQKAGHDSSSSHNEFGEPVRKMRHYDQRWAETQSEYLVIIEGALRDRYFEETLRELNKWLNRLAKRAGIEEILVKLRGYDSNWERKELIISDPKPYHEMAEWPSWSEKSDGEPMWCEYLMWESAKDSWYPLLLTRKYYNDPETDAEVERRIKWRKEEEQ
jgi:hypothetical protein